MTLQHTLTLSYKTNIKMRTFVLKKITIKVKKIRTNLTIIPYTDNHLAKHIKVVLETKQKIASELKRLKVI